MLSYLATATAERAAGVPPWVSVSVCFPLHHSSKEQGRQAEKTRGHTMGDDTGDSIGPESKEDGK